jgi:hypothetical protein
MKHESEFVNPTTEARAVAGLVHKKAESVESALKLIRVTPAQREILFTLFPLPAHTSLEKMFRYRLAVEREFLRIVNGRNRGLQKNR